MVKGWKDCAVCQGTGELIKTKQEPDPTDTAILLAGYIRGLCHRFGVQMDPVAISCLKRLGCPERYLPRSGKPHPTTEGMKG